MFHKSSINSIREVEGYLKYQPNFFKIYKPWHSILPAPTLNISILEFELKPHDKNIFYICCIFLLPIHFKISKQFIEIVFWVKSLKSELYQNGRWGGGIFKLYQNGCWGKISKCVAIINILKLFLNLIKIVSKKFQVKV